MGLYTRLPNLSGNRSGTADLCLEIPGSLVTSPQSAFSKKSIEY